MIVNSSLKAGTTMETSGSSLRNLLNAWRVSSKNDSGRSSILLVVSNRLSIQSGLRSARGMLFLWFVCGERLEDVRRVNTKISYPVQPGWSLVKRGRRPLAAGGWPRDEDTASSL